MGARVAVGASGTTEERATEIDRRLEAAYPGDARSLCALVHRDPFELLVATILSAQCTDERVNSVTPALFAACPTPEAMAVCDPERLEEMIRPTGFFRTKARNLLAMASALCSDHGGSVPADLESLVRLPGVGRKTANVVLSVDFSLPGLPVDTHVGRLARRLGLSASTDPEGVEADLSQMIEPSRWGALSVRLILHGRQVCQSRRPRCGACLLADLCPSALVGAPGASALGGGQAGVPARAGAPDGPAEEGPGPQASRRRSRRAAATSVDSTE